MSLKKDRHPDMNVNDLDYSITYQICQNFDIDRSWELLAGAIGYSTSHIQKFELEIQRANGSPTKKLLWDWGTRGGTIRDLYDKLALINKTQGMRLLEHIVNPDKRKEKKKESKMDNSMSDEPSFQSKSDNCLSSNNPGSQCYDTDSLPTPSMKKCGPVVKETNTVDVNLNMPEMKMDKAGNKPIMFDKLLGTILEPHGASSVEMFAHADGPASTKGNLGAASSAAKSFERVRSVIEEYGSEGVYMSQWSVDEREIAHALIGTPNYTYKELSIATGGFSVHNKLGQGKFGALYYGLVKNTKCAIKKLEQRRERADDEENSAKHLAAELKALSRYRHENIVSLYGYALDNDEVCLVYQYMTNGSLYHCLHAKPGLVLTWEQRLSVLRGSACGLQFLHSVDKKPVIHGDIKSANILLDNHFEAKIGDLGQVKQATGGEVTGRMTHITKKNTSIQDYRNKAYYPPEIARGNGFSVKGDTYSFGVVIYECLTGQEAYDERREGGIEHKYLVGYIQSTLEDSPKLNKQKTFQDPKLKSDFPITMFEILFGLAHRCTEEKKKDRPTMVEVYSEIEKCERDYQGPDYDNIQAEKCKKVDDGSTHVHHMSVVNKVSYSPDLKAPPSINPKKSVPDSPIDMLPKDQPIPEAFKLQMELDQRKQKQPKECEYVNVDQVTQQLKSSYLSDPKKLEDIEKYDKSFMSPSPSVGQPAAREPATGQPASQFRHKEPLENSEKIITSQNIGVKDLDSFEYEFASDPKKLEMLEEQSKILKHASTAVHYVNLSNVGKDNSIKHVGDVPAEGSQGDGDIPTEGSQGARLVDKGTDFEKEFEEITDKAMKGDSSMMGIFDKFHDLVEDEHLFNVPQVDMVGENDEFDIQFDFETEDSETSTLTESINNDFEALNSADYTDDDLFANESQVSYANVQEKVSNENIDASLEEHQKKLSMYQGMTRVDSEELHERSAQPEDLDLSVKSQSLPAQDQGHSSHKDKNTGGIHSLPTQGQGVHNNRKSENQDNFHINKGLSQHRPVGPNQTPGNYSNIGANNENIQKLDRSNGKIANIQDLLQRREPSEGHCEEYV